MTTQRKLKQGDKLTNFKGDIAEIVAFDTESVFVRIVSNMSIEDGKWHVDKIAETFPDRAARIKTQLLFNKGERYCKVHAFGWDEIDEALEGYN